MVDHSGADISSSSSASSPAIGGASAAGARLAVLVNGETFAPGPPANFVVQRSVGVQSVTNPEDGLFCVKPQAGAIPNNQLGRIIPTVASAYTGSVQYQAFAQYVFPRNSSCPAGTISIRTFSANSSGDLDATDNDVQFTVVVD
jgi:hypothetical protein